MYRTLAGKNLSVFCDLLLLGWPRECQQQTASRVFPQQRPRMEAAQPHHEKLGGRIVTPRCGKDVRCQHDSRITIVRLPSPSPNCTQQDRTTPPPNTHTRTHTYTHQRGGTPSMNFHAGSTLIAHGNLSNSVREKTLSIGHSWRLHHATLMRGSM